MTRPTETFAQNLQDCKG